jgi:hypothetical protein
MQWSIYPNAPLRIDLFGKIQRNQREEQSDKSNEERKKQKGKR